MDTSVTVQAPTAPIAPLIDQSKRSQVTPKVRKTLELMVYEGLPRDEAAKQAGLQQNGIYKAFRKPAVKAAYLAMCEDLRISGRAKRLHRLEALAAQDDNLNAAVAAIKAAEQMGEQDVSRTNGSAAQTPGFLITIVNTAAHTGPMRTIEQKPNDINEPVRDQIERPTDATCRDR